VAEQELVHHDLCFGCGQANLFGLQLELERAGDRVEGRFFVKQDHQGPPGYAHAGVLAAALEDALAHASGSWSGRLVLELLDGAPVGSFVLVRARLQGETLAAEAVREDGAVVARARRR
jgi:hypothetical protein